MNQGRMLRKSIVLLTVVSVIILLATGCDCAKKSEALQKENQALTQRVAQLEGQLSQTEAAVAAQAQAAQTARTQVVQYQPVQVKDTIPTTAPAPAEQSQAVQSMYVVKEGDNLWKIAKNQLGNGNRYKEILTLNPTISQDKPLAVGTKLTIPPR